MTQDVPQHRLFWIASARKLKEWAPATFNRHEEIHENSDLAEMVEKFPRLGVYLRLWADRPVAEFTSLLDRIEKESGMLDRRSLDSAVVRLVSLGAGASLRFLQRNWETIKNSLTPQYQQLLKVLDFNIPSQSELMFHCAEPDLYLFQAGLGSRPDRPLLICFCTKSNTLNAPLPIAHFGLQAQEADILYVRNRIGVNPADGLAGLHFEETVHLINALVRSKLGYRKVLGLGASAGGYAACVYAAPLGFDRVLNFSGAAGLEARDQRNRLPLGLRVKDYPLENILSVLSANDKTDQDILAKYRETGFDSKLALVEAKTHGSFTAALLEGKLGSLLNLTKRKRQKISETHAGVGLTASPPYNFLAQESPSPIQIAKPESHLPNKPEKKTDAVKTLDTFQLIPGYRAGLKQSAVEFEISIDFPAEAQTHSNKLEAVGREVHRFLCAEFACPFSDPHENDHPILRFILASIRAVLEANNHPIFDAAVVEVISGEKRAPYRAKILQPCLDFNAAIIAVRLCAETYSAALDHPEGFGKLQRSFSKVFAPGVEKVKQGQLAGFNNLQFLKTAHEMDVPWFQLSGQTFQFGYGSRARLLNSSFTDQTSAISATIARDKILASTLLRYAGLPVMEQVLVGSAQESIQAAQKLGFPVVVKPADQDGGAGVSAFLMKPEQVAQAYETAAKLSSRIIVEKFFSGRDYRLHIVNGAVHGILERSPGGVIGDGVHAVSDLIARQNADRKNAADDRRYLHAISIDDECARMLAIQDLNLASIPDKDRFVRLRGAANVAGGGVPVMIDLSSAHPHNLDLVLKAVRVMRLDVAGVDLLIPDIRQSWRETGAAICEVNAQPQMFTTFHRPMLESLLGETLGGIPIVLVVDDSANTHEFGRELARVSAEKQSGIGFVSENQVLIDDSPTGLRTEDLFWAARSLLIDPRITGLVISVRMNYKPLKGWPVNTCDTVILNTEGNSRDKEFAKKLRSFTQEIRISLRPRVICANAKTLSQLKLKKSDYSIEVREMPEKNSCRLNLDDRTLFAGCFADITAVSPSAHERSESNSNAQ